MNQYVFYNFEGHFPRAKRNFIKENVQSIKQMQGILQDAGVIQPKKKSMDDRYRNMPGVTTSKESNVSGSSTNLTRTIVRTNQAISDKLASKPSNTTSNKSKGKKRVKKNDVLCTTAHTAEEDNRLTHRAMQTVREEDLSRIYDTGVIKYPSPGVLKLVKKGEKSTAQSGQGDQCDNVLEMENLTIEDKDFIKVNKIIKQKAQKLSPVKVMAQAPPNYQRGVVPKYLRDMKGDSPIESNGECPTGHILLPEEERKETLRVLRQSYADRILELNMMPVRNDTLKMKKRKEEIEDELKKIDGGIKVFQRPKVFVKINA